MINSKFQEFENIVQEMKVVYLHDKRPWMIGFSGGKDSTMLVMLVFEMLKQLRPNQINKKIYITSSDTMVENPIVKDYMYRMSKLIGETGEKYGIISNIITPPAEKTFWSYVIGLGYPTPETARIQMVYRSLENQTNKSIYLGYNQEKWRSYYASWCT